MNEQQEMEKFRYHCMYKYRMVQFIIYHSLFGIIIAVCLYNMTTKEKGLEIWAGIFCVILGAITRNLKNTMKKGYVQEKSNQSTDPLLQRGGAFGFLGGPSNTDDQLDGKVFPRGLREGHASKPPVPSGSSSV